MNIEWIALDQIRPSRHQRRRRFDDARLSALAESIRMEGLIEPVTVRKTQDAYELIAGERRFRAAKLAGWEKIPARVISVISEGEASVKGLLTDLQRVALDPMEEAEGIQELNITDPAYWTYDRIAQVIGRSRAYIERALRLLDLPEGIQRDVRLGRLTRDQALTIGRLPPDQQQQIRGLLSDPTLLRQSFETLAAATATESFLAGV